MPYKYIEDISIADVCFEAYDPSLDKMFESAALAVTNTMVRDLKSVKPARKKVVKIEAADIEKLLFEFLQELVFLKDKSLLLFSKVKVKVKEPGKIGGLYSLTAELQGEKLSMKKHELLVDVKAVTWHMFEVKRSRFWKCRVVLDV